ncbi:MAG: aminopeptidase, partial [Clostridia bacterium]|nr:aminopeptidase [Clostridia bacterium]
MEEILYKRKNGYEEMTEDLKKDMHSFNEGYKEFLSLCKTERECAAFCEKIAEKNGFKPLEDYESLKSGDKFYIINRGRAIMMGVMGKKNVWEGTRVVAAHIDSPRLDLKQNPLYEAEELAFFKTHYYGGIKKYQWVAMPLALHGAVILKGGEKLNIVIGEEENDPVFCVTDLLPHLAASQMDNKGGKIIEGEKLNVLVGSEGLMEDEKLSVKNNIMKLLNEKYGICEKDIITADIEVVPAFKAKDVGIDRSMVGSYGQDDRVCAYTSLKAILETENPEYTSICYLVDKEEIGSGDSTGMKS